MSEPSGRKRIAFFAEVGMVGGAERFLRDLVHGLDRDRYDVEVICARNEAFDRFLRQDTAPRSFTMRALDLQTLATSRVFGNARALRRYPLLYRWRSIPKGLLRQANNLRNWPIIVRAVRERAIDILHINNGGYPGGETCRLAALAARRAGIPLRVMTYHNLAEPLTFPKRLDRALDARVRSALQAVIAASLASARSLRDVRAFPGAMPGVIPYGIAEPARASAERLGALRAELRLDGHQVVGSVGSFEPRKGQDVLVRALPAIRALVPTAKVIFIGEGERRAAVQALAHELGVGDAVTFTGHRQDVLDIMCAMDVLAVPSTAYESLPYVVLEAMAVGKSVVGTRVAGIPEAIEDGVTGTLVSPGDAAALAQALVAVLSDPARARGMGAQGRKRYLDRFTLSRMLADFDLLYRAGEYSVASA